MKKVLMMGAALLVASVATAGTHNDAGCGVGEMIFKENKMIDQLLASSTNGTFGQPFSITTGTMGCGKSAKSASLQQESYIAANFRDLSREMAAGRGEYVGSLASLMKCDRVAFGKYTQANYEKLFPTANVTPAQLLGSLKGGLKNTCGAL
jgi:hypothetical protein